MSLETQNDRLLNGIIVYGFSLSFGAVLASLEALQTTATGFTIKLTWWTLLALALGAALMVPCFHTIMHSPRPYLRRAALCFVVVLGLAAFFYPMRVVPPEKFKPVFLGLGVAVVVLSMVACLLLMLRRFFESEEKRGPP
jgi:hypothetical protein